MGSSRRDWLLGAGACGLALLGGRAAVAAVRVGAQRLAAAWQVGDSHRVGWLSLAPGQPVREWASMEVPTRAHGVWTDATGHLVAVARRPGDWLLRWRGPGSRAQWEWLPPLRAFNGHALASPDGRWLWTAETDLDSGAGLLGVRDARSLALHDEWPTHGLDPHHLLWDRLVPQQLFVANGGIATRPETGRVKHELARMDSSLVRLDAGSGRLLGQWRLPDRRLSLRHLAWSGARLGIALQAEHDDAAVRAESPVLAVWEGGSLRAGELPQPLAGYGGDIAAADGGFAVSCPRAGGLAWFEPDGAWRGFTPLAEACALVPRTGGGVWTGGHPGAALGLRGALSPAGALGGRRLDNHWS